MEQENKCKIGFEREHPTSNIRMLEKVITDGDMLKFIKAISSKSCPNFKIQEDGEESNLRMRDLNQGAKIKIMCYGYKAGKDFILTQSQREEGFHIAEGYVLNGFGEKVCLGCDSYNK